jgi:hypothetical protein
MGFNWAFKGLREKKKFIEVTLSGVKSTENIHEIWQWTFTAEF